MSGCFTPPRFRRVGMGADIIKVFPATSVGPGYLRMSGLFRRSS